MGTRTHTHTKTGLKKKEKNVIRAKGAFFRMVDSPHLSPLRGCVYIGRPLSRQPQVEHFYCGGRRHARQRPNKHTDSNCVWIHSVVVLVALHIFFYSSSLQLVRDGEEMWETPESCAPPPTHTLAHSYTCVGAAREARVTREMKLRGGPLDRRKEKYYFFVFGPGGRGTVNIDELPLQTEEKKVQS